MSDKQEVVRKRRRLRRDTSKPGEVPSDVQSVPVVMTMEPDVEYEKNDEAQMDAVEQTVPDIPQVPQLNWDEFFGNVVDHLQAGHTILVGKTESGQVILSASERPVVDLDSGPVQVKSRLGADYYARIITSEYWEFEDMWQTKSMDEKYDYARELGVTWDEKERGSRIDKMRMATAVKKHLGINKWGPGYETRTQRKTAESRYRAGLDY